MHCYTTGNDRYTTLLYYDIQGRLVKEEVWADNHVSFSESLAYGYGEKFDVGGSISEKESGGSAVSQPERYIYRYDRAGQLAEVYSLADNKPYLAASSSRKYRVLLNDGVLDCDTSSGAAICRSMSTSSLTNVVSVEVDSEGQYFQIRNATFTQGGGYLGLDFRGEALVWDAVSDRGYHWHNWNLGDQDFGMGLSRILTNSRGNYIDQGQRQEPDEETFFLNIGSSSTYNSVLVPVDSDDDMYQYDANGNMTLDNGQKRAYNDGTNQMNNFSMTYDANGRVISYDKGAGQVNISYDKGNGLYNSMAYEKTGGAERTYYRNASGRIVETACQGGKSYLTLRGGGTTPLRRIEVEAGQVLKTANYVHGLNGICTVNDSVMGSFSCLNDYQGALRLTFDSDGQKKGEITYDAWGMPKILQGDALHPFYRNDHEYVEDFQVYDAGARIYDPYLKIFCEPDPKMLNHSPYTAFNNNPILFRDYSGEQTGMSILLYNMDEGGFFGEHFEIMWRNVLHIPVRFKTSSRAERLPSLSRVLQKEDDFSMPSKLLVTEQPVISGEGREFTGHIMVALEHGIERGNEFLPTGMYIKGFSAWGHPYPEKKVIAGEAMEEEAYFEKPLGRAVMDCIENGYPVKTISILKCGANPAQMIRATRRAIINEAEFRRASPEIMARVRGVMDRVSLNVVADKFAIGDVADPDSVGLRKFSREEGICTDKPDGTERVTLSPFESEDFVIYGRLPRDKRFMKAYSIAREIPQGEGEEMALMEAADMALALFLLEKDALKDEWTESFEERSFSEEERLFLEKVKEQVMVKLYMFQDVDIKESHRKFLLGNNEHELFIHPIFLHVLNQWTGTEEEKEVMLSLFMENELRQMQVKEGLDALTENDVNELEFCSWVNVLQSCSDEENELLQNFIDFAFSAETDDRQLFDETFKDMREKGFHVAFDKGDDRSKEQLSEKEISERLTHVGTLRQRMFFAPQPYFATSV